MQFKNIIFSAALLAMVSAAPIRDVPSTETVHNGATGTATESTTTAPTKDFVKPDFNWEGCSKTWEEVEGKNLAPSDELNAFVNDCDTCYARAYYEFETFDFEHLTPEQDEEVEDFFNHCDPQGEWKPSNVPRDTVTGIPTKVETPNAEAPKAKPEVEVPKGVNANDATGNTETPSVDAAKNPIKVPTVNTPSA